MTQHPAPPTPPRPAPHPAPAVSLIIPLYNEEVVFPELLDRLGAVIGGFTIPVEVVLIDDGSSDRTPELIREVCLANPNFQGIILSRNFGHQTAVSAGLDAATGKAIAILDGDLQDPPEFITEMLAKMNEGYEVVYAVRTERKENIFKRVAYAGFYRLLGQMSSVHIPLDTGDFCLMSQRVAKLISAMPERNRFIRGMRSWIGFRQIGLTYPRSARAAGDSKYTLRKLFRLAFDGIFSFSDVPLKIAGYLGFLVAVSSFVYAAYLVIWKLFLNREAVPGFATLAVAMLFLGGVQLITIWILGQYIGRIYTEVKGRPLYVVAEFYRQGTTIDMRSENGQR